MKLISLLTFLSLFFCIFNLSIERKSNALSHNKAKRRGAACWAWKVARGTAKSLCIKAVGFVAGKGAAIIKQKACPCFKVLSGLCIKAVDALGNLVNSKADVCCEGLCKWVDGKCRRLLRHR